jgi:nucleotidyltransferase substrate binding protein (TIGR01987 family)
MTESNKLDIRWQQRFDNFQLAFRKLDLAVSTFKIKPDDELIAIAVIKSFEFTYELGWKTLKDYLEYTGIEVKLPREVIKQAFANELIEDGQTWINMLEDRNLMAHTYSDERAKVAIDRIINQYFFALESFQKQFRIFLT